EAAAPGRRQDPRPLDRPLLPGHPAAAGRQGAVRRPALRRNGGVGARGLRRRVHPPGDADDQVRRHGRPGQGLRGDRQGREHRRALDPESFKVLLKEMQSLALDVNVVSEEGERAEMREEDDDLLRAAEELGIDLSGVRATDGAAADEATEHEGETAEASEDETEDEDPDMESGEDLESEDFSSDEDPMIDEDVPVGEAEGVLDED